MEARLTITLLWNSRTRPLRRRRKRRVRHKNKTAISCLHREQSPRDHSILPCLLTQPSMASMPLDRLLLSAPHYRHPYLPLNGISNRRKVYIPRQHRRHLSKRVFLTSLSSHLYHPTSRKSQTGRLSSRIFGLVAIPPLSVLKYSFGVASPRLLLPGSKHGAVEVATKLDS